MNISYREVILLLANIEYIAGICFLKISQKIKVLHYDHHGVYSIAKQDVEEVIAIKNFMLQMLQETLDRLSTLFNYLKKSNEPVAGIEHALYRIYLPFLRTRDKTPTQNTLTLLDFYKTGVFPIESCAKQHALSFTTQYYLTMTLMYLQKSASNAYDLITASTLNTACYYRHQEHSIYQPIAPKPHAASTQPKEARNESFANDTLKDFLPQAHDCLNHLDSYLNQYIFFLASHVRVDSDTKDDTSDHQCSPISVFSESHLISPFFPTAEQKDFQRLTQQVSVANQQPPIMIVNHATFSPCNH